MAERNEQREAERFPINAHSSIDFASPVLEDFGPVRIKNISTKGVGLVSTESLAVGLMIVINLVNPAKKFSKTMRVQIVHCGPQAGGSYLSGGIFVDPLTYEELCILVM